MDITEEEFRIYIGKGADYYIERFNKIRSGRIISINFYAFFFGLFWLLYRKMYLTGIIVLLIAYLAQLVENTYFKTNIVSHIQKNDIAMFVVIFVNLAFASLSNWIYYQDAVRKITLIKSKGLPTDEYKRALEFAGGVNWITVVGLIIIFLLPLI